MKVGVPTNEEELGSEIAKRWFSLEQKIAEAGGAVRSWEKG